MTIPCSNGAALAVPARRCSTSRTLAASARPVMVLHHPLLTRNIYSTASGPNFVVPSQVGHDFSYECNDMHHMGYCDGS